MGQSILSATLLSPNTIRQWMKPVTFTSQVTQAVGMPWEIVRVSDVTSHVFDLYTKSGDVFSYSALFVLAPDYNIGFVVMVAAATDSTSTVQYLSDTIAANIFPALEQTARAQAQKTFGETYTSMVAGVASNMTLTTAAGQPGLLVESWYSNGTDFMEVIALLYGATTVGVDIRLYPSGLEQQTSPTSKQVGFRMVIETKDTVPDGGIFSEDCQTWFSVDALVYGNVGVDEFVFNVQNGTAVSVNPRALRATLRKTA